MNNPFKELEVTPVTLAVETIAQEAKRLLKDIPGEMWCVSAYMNRQGQSCALGHYAIEKGYTMLTTSYGFFDATFDFRNYTKKMDLCVPEYDFKTSGISEVNNKPSKRYPQRTPKERVMAFLDDMIAAGY